MTLPERLIPGQPALLGSFRPVTAGKIGRIAQVPGRLGHFQAKVQGKMHERILQMRLNLLIPVFSPIELDWFARFRLG